MGFMAGFGSAFSQAFNAENERAAQREDDLFKVRFDSVRKHMEEQKKRKEQDLQDISFAKSVAQTLPTPEAWTQIYQWKKSGWSEAQIFHAIENGTFNVEPADMSAPQAPDTVEGSSQGIPDPRAVARAEGGEERPNGLLTQTLEGFGLKRTTPEQRVDRRVAKAMGMSPDEFEAQSNVTYEPQDLPGDPSRKITYVRNPKKEDGLNSLVEVRIRKQMARDAGNEEEYQRLSNIEKALTTGELQDKTEYLGVQDNFDQVKEGRAEKKTIDAEVRAQNYKIEDEKRKENSIASLDSEEEITTALVKAEQANDAPRVQALTDLLNRQSTLAEIQSRRNAMSAAAAKGEAYIPMLATRKDTGELVTRTADGSWVGNKSGQVVQDDDIQVYSKEELDYLDKEIQRLDKPIQEFNSAVDGLAGTVRAASEIVEISKRQPYVLTRVAGGVQFLDSLVRDAQGAVHLIAGGDKNLIGKEKMLEEKLQSQLAKGISDLATERSLAEAKMTRITYNMLRSQGQEGRSVSVQEFETTKNDLFSNGNIKAFRQSMAEYIIAEKGRLDRMQKNINESSPGLRTFEARFQKKNPYPPVQSVDVLLGDDTLTRYDDIIKTATQPNPMGQIQTDGDAPPTNEAGQPIVDPIDWQYMTPEERQLFLKPEGN